MKKSAGIVLYRMDGESLRILLVHPGGPFWKKKDLGAWSIPKGEYTDEDAFDAAARELEEETGFKLLCSRDHGIKLQPVKQSGGKVVTAFAMEGDWDPSKLVSNRFTMAWPPRSGRTEEFPEVDRAEWFDYETALEKIVPGQAGLLKELLKILESRRSPDSVPGFVNKE